MATAKPGAPKKTKRVVESEGIAHVNATFNNTTHHDHRHARQHRRVGVVGQGAVQGLQEVHAVRRHRRRRACARRKRWTLGVRRVHVRVQGPGSGRESAIQALAAAGLQIKSIKDVTPIPHNGCRPPKRRRV